VKGHQITVEGELYLSLETYAEIFRIQVTWLRDVYDRGLLGEGVPSEAWICVASTQMDRIATLVRLHNSLGVDIDTLAWLLED